MTWLLLALAILLIGAMAVLLLSRAGPPSHGSYGATGRNLSWLCAASVVMAQGAWAVHPRLPLSTLTAIIEQTGAR